MRTRVIFGTAYLRKKLQGSYRFPKKIEFQDLYKNLKNAMAVDTINLVAQNKGR